MSTYVPSIFQSFASQLRKLNFELDELFFQMFSISYYYELDHFKANFMILSKKLDALDTKIHYYLTSTDQQSVEFQLLSKEMHYVKNRLKIFFVSFEKSDKIIQLAKSLDFQYKSTY